MSDVKLTYEDYTSGGKYKVIGTRPIRHDGEDKVTGRAIYGADVRYSRPEAASWSGSAVCRLWLA